MLNKLHIVRASFNQIINYSYLIENTLHGTAIAIDPAWDLDQFVKIIDGNGLQLKAIFLTHSHIDHTNLAEDLTQRYNCDVYIRDVEANFYGFDCSNIKYISTPESIFIDSLEVRIFFSAGHTTGGCSYIIDDMAFTGDTLFIEGCGICDSHGGDVQEMYDTMQRIKLYFDNKWRIFPGHRYGKELGLEFQHVMKQNVYLQFNNFEVFKRFRMRKNSNHKMTFI